jgi:TolB-like protein
LIVISRSVTQRFDESEVNLGDIARELNVDAFVRGSVLREGNQVIVSARLVKPETGQNLWADSYQQDLKNILVVADEMARAVAAEIHVTLTPEEETRLAGAREVNPEAYTDYLQGMFH